MKGSVERNKVNRGSKQGKGDEGRGARHLTRTPGRKVSWGCVYVWARALRSWECCKLGDCYLCLTKVLTRARRGEKETLRDQGQQTGQFANSS